MNSRIIWIVSIFFLSVSVIAACINKTPSQKEPLDIQELTKNQPEEHGNLIKPEDVHLTTPLIEQWVAEG